MWRRSWRRSVSRRSASRSAALCPPPGDGVAAERRPSAVANTRPLARVGRAVLCLPCAQVARCRRCGGRTRPRVNGRPWCSPRSRRARGRTPRSAGDAPSASGPCRRRTSPASRRLRARHRRRPRQGHPEGRVEAEQIEPVDARTVRVARRSKVRSNSQPVELRPARSSPPTPGGDGNGFPGVRGMRRGGDSPRRWIKCGGGADR